MKKKMTSKVETQTPSDYPLLREYIRNNAAMDTDVYMGGRKSIVIETYQIPDWETYIPLWEEFRKYSRFNMPSLPGQQFPAELSDGTRINVLSPFTINEEIDDSFLKAWEKMPSYQEFLSRR